ncbi:MAG TPA: right-handed parallel beta-helix repeat-containing protein [Pyrinomonadaceae bacterium]|jgi:hypothetical protein
MSFQRSVSLSTVVLLCSVLSHAQATRTWVSGVGDDVNPCSRTAPCKTFAGAISKTATNGEINCIDPGGFGAVTITKSITIDCTGTFGSILASLTNGINIKLADTDVRQAVRLRGIEINGSGNGLNGIRVMSDKTNVTIENVVIDGFTQNGLSIESGGSVVINSSSIYGNETGISVTAKGNVRLIRSLVTANTTGVAATSGLVLSYSDNLIEGNGKNGNFSPASTP